jgi:hypothetical protein
VIVGLVVQLSVAVNAGIVYVLPDTIQKACAGGQVITGASVSLVKVIVCVAVPVLPHASVTVHVLIIERSQPVPVSAPSVKVAVRPVEQLSVTDAVPKAAVS